MKAWDIFEITTTNTLVQGVMLRGRIRKFSLTEDFQLFVENATDKENCVRFAVSKKEDATKVIAYLKSRITDVSVAHLAEGVPNPVLSKMKVNDESRYTL